jgi:putative NADPH-quinone reductase
MRCLVVHAHPVAESFNRALLERTVAGLHKAGHRVEVLDLYQIGYNPNLSTDEHRAYESIGRDHPDPVVASHIAAVQATDALVFVYPTWWSGLPAILKGWCDRTLLPHVAFDLDRQSRPDGGDEVTVTPRLSNITRVAGVTTYGSSRLQVRLMGDEGRRSVTRTVRMVCARRCRTTWLGLHRLDTVTDDDRRRFLDRVESTFQGWDR